MRFDKYNWYFSTYVHQLTINTLSIMLLQIPLLGIIGMQEVLIIAVVVLVLFGGKKIPELMRGLGSGVKSFKEGMKEGMPEDDAKKDAQQKTEDKEEEKKE